MFLRYEDDLTTAVAAGLDLSGDGQPDLALSARAFEGGRVWVYDAGWQGFVGPWQAEAMVTPASNGYDTGAGVAMVPLRSGDLSGSLLASDLLIHDADEMGRYYVLDKPLMGQVSVASASAELSSPIEAWFMNTMAAAGDVDRDGVPDILFGSAFPDEGVAYLFYAPVPPGRHSLSEADAIFRGEDANDQFGEDVAGAGDVNDDGYDDILLSAPNRGDLEQGVVYLFDGPVTGILDARESDAKLFGVPGELYCSPPPNCELRGPYTGSFVAAAGDVNGDGFADILMGAPGTPVYGAYLMYGPLVGDYDLRNPDVQFSMAETGSTWSPISFNFTVTGPFDINGDGYSDIVLANEGANTGAPGYGAIHVWFGPLKSAAPSVGTADIVLVNPVSGTRMGLGVAAAGDVEGDGRTDLFVLAEERPLNGGYPAAAFLILGRDIVSGSP